MFCIVVVIAGEPLDKREVEKRHQARIHIGNKIYSDKEVIDAHE